MRKISLNGQWNVEQDSGDRKFTGTVPGCVHTDLLAAGHLPDLWWRDNETQYAWPWLEAWSYRKEFNLEETDLNQDGLLLKCEGLDTFATIVINDTEVARADNMFRTWIIDIKGVAKKGVNTIRVKFDGEYAKSVELDKKKSLPAWNLYHNDYKGKSYLRKMACSFGWDWGPMAPTVGMWRDVSILVVDSARIEAVRVDQQHGQESVVLAINSCVDALNEEIITQHVKVTYCDNLVAETSTKCGNDLSVEINDPQLWWPKGMGEQALYKVVVHLEASDGRVLDTKSEIIGLRTINVQQDKDEYGTSFRFIVNGRPVFAKGANWIPCDVFIPRISDDTYDHLLTSAADSNMNMIRVWGGGFYEQDYFYQRCDELGLMIWQDFMFACSTYPSFDDVYMQNVRAEAVDNVRRLANHPCIALWCGNNELEMALVHKDGWNETAMSWEDYTPLFDELLKDVVAEYHPTGFYWPCSPHTPIGDRHDFNNDSSGDAHAWSVWFKGEPFEAQRNWTYRFMSEFGFQSFPEPRTVEAFTEPEDRNLTSWVMDFHQRSGPGNPTIFKYLMQWFKLPNSFENTLWMTQLTQALCIQYAAEHARRIQGRMDGLLFWQLNDIWPAATWSSIDVNGRWKALQFLSKRFFAPVLSSVLEDREKDTMALHVSNHNPEDFMGTLHWRIVNASGDCLQSGEEKVKVSSQSNHEIKVLDCQSLRKIKGGYYQPLEIRFAPFPALSADREILVWTQLIDEEGNEMSRNLGLFAKPKQLALKKPEFEIEISSKTKDCHELTIKSSVPSPWTRLEIVDADVAFSDNFIHLDPSMPATITVRKCRAEQLRSDLLITPLIDTSSVE